MQLTGAQILWECLVREGVDTVFGYPGGAILPAYDAMLDYPVRHVLVRHEQGAAHMADGYARASGKVGVAVATSGPGATNLTTGIATAMLDSVPTVFITGQVPSKLLGTDAFQETDVTGITLPITKHNYLVTDARELARTIREAFLVARSGRPGPVLVDICKDTQQSKVEFEWPEKIELPGEKDPAPPRPEDLRRAVELIEKAERPLILAGHGVIRSGSSRLLQEYVDKTGTPVALDPPRPRRLPGQPPALAGDDGHARRGLREHGHPEGRPAPRLRDALRRPRDRQPQDLRAQREEDPRGDRRVRGGEERAGGRAPDRRPSRDPRGASAPRPRRSGTKIGSGRSPRGGRTPAPATSSTSRTRAGSSPPT